MGEALGLDKEKPNRVTKVAVKMLKCKLAVPFKSSQSCGVYSRFGLMGTETNEISWNMLWICQEKLVTVRYSNRFTRSLESRLQG